MQDFYPLQILLNGAACYLRISLNLTAPVPNFAANGTLVEDSQSPITATDGQLTGMCLLQLKHPQAMHSWWRHNPTLTPPMPPFPHIKRRDAGDPCNFQGC